MTKKFDETQKTLSLILAKLISPTRFQADGFAAPRDASTPL